MTDLLIGGLIGAYSLRLIWVKYRAFRDGKTCGGCCRDCRGCKK